MTTVKYHRRVSKKGKEHSVREHSRNVPSAVKEAVENISKWSDRFKFGKYDVEIKSYDKLVGKRYYVAIEEAYFGNKYVGVKDMETGERALAWLPSYLFNKKLKDRTKSAETLYNYLDTPEKCKRFLAGKITKVRTSPLEETWGENVLFESHG